MESSVSDAKREQATVWITVTAEAMAAVHRLGGNYREKICLAASAN